MRSSKLRSAAGSLLVSLLLVSGCAQHPPSPGVDASSRAGWIESVLKGMTVEQKIGQMIMIRAYGTYYSTEGDEFRKLRRLIHDRAFGGVVCFQGDVDETALLVNRLQSMAAVPLLVAADFEWGTAMRIRRSTRFPEAMAVAATRDTSLAYQMGAVTGEESRAMGVLHVFAPVADVNVNPENPVINTRSFGEDPVLVGAMASALASGLQSAGVLATAKHFPGHGDTRTDSHLDLPLIGGSRARLDSVELSPYGPLIRHNVASIMVGHLEVPALEPKRIPATLSRQIIGDLLRRQMGFNGLIVTDAMDMGALVSMFGTDSAAVRAVEAGADLLLVLPDEDAAVRGLEDAVAAGRIPIERLDGSVRRILGAKWDLGLVRNRFADLNDLPAHVATPGHLQLAKTIARAAITLLKNDSVLPLDRWDGKKILNVVVADIEQYRTEINRPGTPWPNEAAGDYLTAQIRKRALNVETVRLDPGSNEMDFDDVYRKARSASVILCELFTKGRSGSGTFGLTDDLVAAVDSLCGMKAPVVAVALGNPYVLGAVRRAGAAICTYSDCEPVSEATAELLFGEIPAEGKLPVTIPDLYPYGTGLALPQSVLRRESPDVAGANADSLALVDSIMVRAVRDSAFPGGQLAVVRDGMLVYDKSFGRQEYSPSSPEINNSTMYDLASLTKVVATTPCVMKLYEDGVISFDDPVVKYLPEFGNKGKERITIRNLLLHNGGLPPFKRLFLTCTSPEQVLDSVLQTETVFAPGDSTLYSDFDFILLGKIVEKLTGLRLEQYAAKQFFQPLAMTRTMFRPPDALRDNIAPTEFDSLYRHMLVRGQVHDENAAALGGVSGHAGLFSTASDLAVYMQMLQNGGTYGKRQFLKPETVKLFTTRQSAKSTRALGWDTKTTKGYSTAGSLMGGNTYGHTGFTGTSVWADPDSKIFIILLTNRVYPTRNNSKIQQIRPAVADAVMRAFSSSTRPHPRGR